MTGSLNHRGSESVRDQLLCELCGTSLRPLSLIVLTAKCVKGSQTQSRTAASSFNDSILRCFNDSLLQWVWLCLRAPSNSSPGCHPTSLGCDAPAHPNANPNRAITASPAKFMLGSYSSLGWW